MHAELDKLEDVSANLMLGNLASQTRITWLGSCAYVLYGVKYIDLVSLESTRPVNPKLLDLSRAPYVFYGVKYIDLVSPEREGVSANLMLGNLASESPSVESRCVARITHYTPPPCFNMRAKKS